MKKLLLCLVFAMFVTVACQKNNVDDDLDMDIEVVEVEENINQESNEDQQNENLDEVNKLFEQGKQLLESVNDDVNEQEKTERIKEVIDNFEQALSIKENADWIWGDLGRAFSAKGDFESAVEKYSKAIELNGKRSVYYDWRANAYEQLGNADLAEQDRVKANELHEQGLD